MESRLSYLGDPQAILSAVRELIETAQQSIVLQMYLFAGNGDQTLLLPRVGAFPYAQTVAGWLIARKKQRPELLIAVILDSNTPDNPKLTRRRGPLIRSQLREAGILVLTANLFHTEFDRRRRIIPAMNFHLQHESVALTDWVEQQNRWQSLHNVEDHRKNLVIDGGQAGAITSHNFFDPAFDWHENMFWLTGSVARDLWRTALSALQTALELPQDLSGEERRKLDSLVSSSNAPSEEPSGELHCALLDTKSIRGRIVKLLWESGAGDEVVIATAYFSDRLLLSQIEAAVLRGARVRVLIDSLHALPLPPLGSWLTRNLVNHAVIAEACGLMERFPERFQMRIHESKEGAMMHLKTVARLGQSPLLIGGQANFTPNSFSGAYLETDLETNSPVLLSGFSEHFEKLWGLPQSAPLSRPIGIAPVLRMWFCTLLLWLFARVGLRP